MSEDIVQQDSQFTVWVDGQQVGGTYNASALHSSGDSGIINLTGHWDTGAHDVKIQFLNASDRNLYADSIAYDGTTYANTSLVMIGAGTYDFKVGGSTPAATAPADTLVLHLSEDAFHANAQFTLSIDGKRIPRHRP